MRIVPISQARPGMRLGQSIIDTHGRLVLSAGVTLQERYISLLWEQGYSSLYIGDNIADVELPEIIHNETRQQVIQCVKDFVQAELISVAPERSFIKLDERGRSSPGQAASRPPAQEHKRLLARVAMAAEVLVNEVLSSPEVMIAMVDLKSMNDVSFAHSVQVAVISLVVARTLGLPSNKLRELGTGAILHDIGRTAIPLEVWNRKGPLADDEWQLVRSHPRIGFDTLTSGEVGLLAAHVAFQHHERWNGTGYPRGLVETDIIKYARICSVCDVYDAMTSDRPVRPAIHPYEALNFICSNSGVLFDPEVVKALSNVVAPYPVATSVLLSTGETAVVKKLNKTAMDRPVVLAIKGPDRKYYTEFHEIDLSTSDIEIVKYLSWYDEVDEPGDNSPPMSGETRSALAKCVAAI